MNNIFKAAVLAGSLLGCTAKDACEDKAPRPVNILGNRTNSESCDDINDQEARKHCDQLIKTMREAAVGACITRESGIAIECTESGEKFTYKAAQPAVPSTKSNQP